MFVASAGIALVFLSMATSHADFPNAVEGQPLPSLAPILERVTPAVVNIATSGRVQQRNPLMDDPFFRRFLVTRAVRIPGVLKALARESLLMRLRGWS